MKAHRVRLNMTPVIDETTSEIVIGYHCGLLESSEEVIPDAIKHYTTTTSSIYSAGGHQAANLNDPPSFSRNFKFSVDIPDTMGVSSA